MANRAALELRPKTLKHNREMLNAAIEHFGSDYSVRDLTVESLQGFAQSRKGELSSSTRRHYMRILGQALRWACNQGWIQSVPAIELPKEAAPRQEWLRSHEIAPFLDACSPAFFPLAEAAIYFGLREGEVCQAQAGDFDLSAGFLWIRPKPELQWSPKNSLARGIPLVGPGRRVAEEIAQRPFTAWAWPNLKGERRVPNPWFAQRSRRAAECAGITRPLVYHDLRRTFGAMLIEAGASMRAVQVALGHKSVRTTERVYAPVTGKFVAAEMAKLGELLDRREEEHRSATPQPPAVGLRVVQ